MNPLVTIIIPTHNCQSYIEKALESISIQTFRDFEVLIIDALSTDGTLQFIKKFKGKMSIRIISETDDGIYHAMNKGIENATGEWIYFMGADDELFNNSVLERVSKYFNRDHDLLYGDVYWVPGKHLEAGILKNQNLICSNINHQRIFYKTSLFNLYGKFNTKYKIAADHELNVRFFCHQEIIKKYIPEAIANYHSGGFSANQTDELFWKDWDSIILHNFKSLVPRKKLYSSLFVYYRFLIDSNHNSAAASVLLKNLKNTYSPGFFLLALKYLLLRKLLGTRKPG